MRDHPKALAGAAAALALALVGRSAVAAPGGRPWRELTSEDFVLRTDLPSERAHALVGELELQRALLLAAMFDRQVPSPERLEVVAFADRAEFVQVTGSDRLEGFFRADPAGRRRIVLSGGIEAIQGSVVAHELVHFLSERFIRYQPRWLGEGLAMYFQTVGEGKGPVRRAGTLPGTGHLAALRRGPLPTAELLAWRGDAGPEEQRCYATSWLLVHYLMNAEHDAFVDYQRRLARGEAPRRAWNAAFPAYGLDQPGGPARLDARLAAHMKSRDWEALPVEAQVTVAPAERELPASAVHGLRLELGAGSVSWTRLRDEAEAALAEDPDHLGAMATLAEGAPARAAALARRAITAHPDDPDAWTLVARASRGAGSLAAREAAHRHALALDPARFDVRVLLAGDLFAAGRPEEAEAEARHAVRLAPWSVASLDVQAMALMALARCDEAIEAKERAVDLAAENVTPAAAAATAKGLAGLEQRCRDDRLREADVLTLRAVLAVGRNDAGAARPLLEEALRRDPDDHQALLALAGVERSLEHLEAAERLAVRYLALAPDDPVVRPLLADVQRARGRFALAEGTQRDQLRRFPDDGWTRIALVELLLDTRRPAEARRELKAFGGPTRPGSAVALARARLGLVTGAEPDAAVALKRAVADDPHPDVEAMAASAFAEAGVELDLAAEWARRASAEQAAVAAEAPLDALGPDHADASAELLAVWGIAGRIEARRGHLAEAEGLLSAAERAGAGPEVSAFLAEALDAAGRRDEAVRAAGRALAVSPGQRVALRVAGSAAAAGPGRGDLVALRTIPVPGAAALPARDLLVALGKDGRILRLAARDAAPLPLSVEALAGVRHGVAFPADGPPFLVVAATLRCSEAACAVVLGREAGAEGGAAP